MTDPSLTNEHNSTHVPLNLTSENGRGHQRKQQQQRSGHRRQRRQQKRQLDGADGRAAVWQHDGGVLCGGGAGTRARTLRLAHGELVVAFRF